MRSLFIIAESIAALRQRLALTKAEKDQSGLREDLQSQPTVETDQKNSKTNFYLSNVHRMTNISFNEKVFSIEPKAELLGATEAIAKESIAPQARRQKQKQHQQEQQ